MANAKDILENIKTGAGLFQEKLEKIPGIKKTGEFLREKVKESFEAQKQLSDIQGRLAFRAATGREPTPEELEKIPVVSIDVGTLKDISKIKNIDKVANTAIEKLVQTIKTAKPAREELEKAMTLERTKRTGQVAKTLIEKKGEEAFIAAKGALKGELVPKKPIFEPLKTLGKLDQNDIDNLFIQIQRHPILSPFEKINAADGFSEILNGIIPQPHKLSLLEDVFGKELIEETLKKRPVMDKIKDLWTEAVNIPRSLITSFDMSAPLRQGVFFMTKPKSVIKASREMFRQAFSENNYKDWLLNIKNDPFYRTMRDSGLYIADHTKIATGLSSKEERFMSNLAEKIPILGKGIRASERAYTSYLNKLRVDIFSNITNKLQKMGLDFENNQELYKSFAEYVNNGTGRGDLGKLGRNAQLLNTLFFSPRLIASRFNLLNPLWYVKQPKLVRREAIKNFAEFVGLGTTILTLAKLSGADVEIDPRSTDFGKIRIGNTRWDIWGGFQQWVRVFSQLTSGERKTQKGEIVPLTKKKYPFETRLDVTERFLRGKLAPVPALFLELLEGQKIFGEKLKLTSEFAENSIPLYLQDINETLNEIGPSTLLTVGLPAFFGVGIQTYEEKKKTNRFNIF